MNHIETIASNNQPEYNNTLIKIDRFIRLFKMTKSADISTITSIKQKCKQLASSLQKIDAQKYRSQQQKINKYIQDNLTQQKLEKTINKSKSQVNKSESNKIASYNSLNSNSNLNANTHSNSNLKRDSQAEGFLQSVSSSESLGKCKEDGLESQRSLDSGKIHKDSQDSIDFNKKQSSADMSDSINDPFKTNQGLKQYCQTNSNNLQSKISINDDVLAYIKNLNPQRVILFGVQKPYNKNIDKLYISTFMQFGKEQVTSMKFKAKDYQAELQEFANIIRYPLGLCVIGQSISDMKMHYIKFLIQMTSPAPLVLIYNQTAPEKSMMIRMNDKIISNIESSNMIEMDKVDSLVNMKDRSKYKYTSIKDITIAKDKCILTKQLFRRIKNEVIQFNQAIVVETCNQKIQKKVDKVEKVQVAEVVVEVAAKVQEVKVQVTKNQVKMEEKEQVKVEVGNTNNQQFRYLLHAKFMATALHENFVYFINENKEINSRKKTKSIQESVEYIRNSNTNCIIGYSPKMIDRKIPTQLFTSFLSLSDKCPMIMLRIKTLTLNKMALISISTKVTEQELNNSNIVYKDIEERKWPFIHILLLGQKTQLLKYQGKNVLQQI